MKILLNIEKTFRELLQQEDTDQDKKITKDDLGPKRFVLVDELSKKEQIIEGTYHLSNLLQELAILKEKGEITAEVDLDSIIEEPVQRISRKIRDDYWHDNPKKDEKLLKKYGAVRIVLEENINKILS